MNRRLVTSALALAVSFGVATASHAAVHPGVSSSNKPAKVKQVSFSLQNNASTALTVQMGDQQQTIEPGKIAQFKMAQGAQLIAVNAAGLIKAGDVVATADSMLSGNTIVVN